MKIQPTITLKAIATSGILAATPFLAHAGGPDFSGLRVTADNIYLDSTFPSIEFEESDRTDAAILQRNSDLLFLFNAPQNGIIHTSNLLTGNMTFGKSLGTTAAPYHFIPTFVNTPAQILCDNSSEGTVTPRNMFELRNNGAPRFVLRDTSLSGVNSYTFAMNPQGNFTMTRAGVPGSEFTLQANGEITMGPGTTTSFRVTNSGVQATSYTTLSDREAKTDIEEVNSTEILDKLKQLPVSTWRFKGDKKTERHIGPMAQDFHKVFGEGDKEVTTINLSDMAGVALSGVKSLDQKVEEQLAAKDAEIHELREALQTERERLDRIEKMLMEKD